MKLTAAERAAFLAFAGALLALPAVRRMEAFTQHGDTSCLHHCLAVAYLSFRICRALRMDRHWHSLVRGALLHDFFLYDWHEKHAGHPLHGFTHPGTALRNASLHFALDDRERDIIARHMWPLTPRFPRYREAYIVCLADKICSLRETLFSSPYRKMDRELGGLIPAGYTVSK